MRLHEARTRCCCRSCGAPREHETDTCIVTMQHGDEDESCMFNLAEYPPQRNWESVLDASIMANNLHEKDADSHKVGSHRRVYGSGRAAHGKS